MPALTGFSHGAAGFAYALMRLHAVTRRADFREAAEAALVYENRLFIADVQNWPDLRHHVPQDACGNQWCHGAAGIALGRLLMLPELDTGAIRRDLAAGLKTTRTAAHGALDDLCCGNAGRLDILFTAGQVLDREDFRQDAWHYARAMMHRAEREGHYRLVDSRMKGIFAPGLFKGTSGVGYTLLRLTRPEELPSILSLDWNQSKTAS